MPPVGEHGASTTMDSRLRGNDVAGTCRHIDGIAVAATGPRAESATRPLADSRKLRVGRAAALDDAQFEGLEHRARAVAHAKPAAANCQAAKVGSKLMDAGSTLVG